MELHLELEWELVTVLALALETRQVLALQMAEELAWELDLDVVQVLALV